MRLPKETRRRKPFDIAYTKRVFSNPFLNSLLRSRSVGGKLRVARMEGDEDNDIHNSAFMRRTDNLACEVFCCGNGKVLQHSGQRS